MSLLKEAALERFYLLRRIEYLDIMDNFAEHALYEHECEADVSDKDPKLNILRNHYKDVMDPAHLADTIKKIYPAKLYGKITK